jgi:threonine dehydrogenase-like Zn-dependent dehydrogenase
MIAVTYGGANDVRVLDKPTPALQDPADALLRVRLAGLCGSDGHVVRGKVPDVAVGTTLGHEFVGEVVDAGRAARVAVGARYVGGFFAACGGCESCLRRRWRNCGRYQVFGHGATLGSLEGAQAEYVRVPLAHQTLAPLPDGVSDEDAIFCCDILPTAFTALDQSRVRPGDRLAIIGAGPVGLVTVMAAVHFGVAKIVVVEVSPSRRKAAEAIGAEAFAPSDLDSVLSSLDGGADVVVEAVGTAQTLSLAWQVARRGATVALVGMLIDEPWPYSAGDTWLKWLTVRPIFGDANAYRPALLKLIEAGRLRPSTILSDVFPIVAAAAAYQSLLSQSGLKLALRAGA